MWMRIGMGNSIVDFEGGDVGALRSTKAVNRHCESAVDERIRGLCCPE